MTASSGKPCALITGAAAGIGRATARLLVQRGWFVGVGDVDEEGLSAIVSELGADNAIAFRLDTSLPEHWMVALGQFFERTGRLDTLINNAGLLVSGPLESLPLPDHYKLIEVNVKGVLNGCYLARPYLAKTRGARVINLSSIAAVYGQASMATYSMTKFAVRGLTEALNIEWQGDGIRVMDVMPMFVVTAMIKDMNAKSIERLGVHLEPEDVAKVIWKAVNYRGGFGKVHWPVGLQGVLMHRLTGMIPDRVSRFFARQLAV